MLGTGCGTTAKFVYPADGRDLTVFPDGPTYQKKVAVVPFEDMRGNENSSGTMYLYLIPGMPFSWVTYERPDAARMFVSIAEFEFDASEDLAKAAAYSFRKSGLFEDAFFTFGGDKEKADWILEGEMISTNYQGNLWTYGLSVYGPALWFLGLPAGTSYNEMVLTMRLSDVSTGILLWEQAYNRNSKIIQGLYYSMGHDIRGYADLYQDIMNDAVQEIGRSSLE
jgi:hypothetical protein